MALGCLNAWYWVKKAHDHFAAKGLEITREHPVPGDGAVDLLAERPGERIAIEIETKQHLSEALTLKMNNMIAAFKEDFKKRYKL